MVFFYANSLNPRELERFFYLFGLVPARYAHPQWAQRLGFPAHDYWPFLTSMFLHGGWAHIIGNMNDAENTMRACELTDPDVPIDIVLHTPGGLVLAALQIAHAVHHHKGEVTVFIPHYAMSGGTLIALAADEIVMSPHAMLGPVDPQLGQYPAASLLKVVAKKPIAEVDDHTLILADIAEKAVSQVSHSVKQLLTRSVPLEKAEELASLLSKGTWTHDYPITVEEAQGLGLKVQSTMPPEFLQLMSLFPQPVRRHPSVEYRPIPRRTEPPRAPGVSE